MTQTEMRLLNGKPLKGDPVHHPKHYNSGSIEVMEAIDDWKLNFARGSVIKYTARAGKKDPAKEKEDLQKAIWYLRWEIEILEALEEKRPPRKPNEMAKKK